MINELKIAMFILVIIIDQMLFWGYGEGGNGDVSRLNVDDGEARIPRH